MVTTGGTAKQGSVEGMNIPSKGPPRVGNVPWDAGCPSPYLLPTVGGKQLQDMKVVHLVLPLPSQKRAELEKSEIRHAELLGKTTPSSSDDLCDIQRLALAISQVYSLGIYNAGGDALVAPDLAKSAGVLRQTIEHIVVKHKACGGKVFPVLHYSLAKIFALVAERATDPRAADMQSLAEYYYQQSEDFPGSAFALLALKNKQHLTTHEGIVIFRQQIASLQHPEEDRAYYAGKFFRNLAGEAGVSSHFKQTYQDLSKHYFSISQGCASYRGDKSKTYMATDTLDEVREMRGNAKAAGEGSKSSVITVVKQKIEEIYTLILGKMSSGGALDGRACAVLAWAHLLEGEITGDKRVKEAATARAFQYQQAANALGVATNIIDKKGGEMLVKTGNLCPLKVKPADCPEEILAECIISTMNAAGQISEEAAVTLIEEGRAGFLQQFASSKHRVEEMTDALIVRIEKDPEACRDTTLALISDAEPDVLERLDAIDNHPADVEASLKDAIATAHDSMKQLFVQERNRWDQKQKNTGDTTPDQISDMGLWVEMIKRLDDFEPKQLRRAVSHLEKEDKDAKSVMPGISVHTENAIVELLLDDESFLGTVIYRDLKRRTMRSSGEIIERIKRIEEIFVCKKAVIGREMYGSDLYKSNIVRMVSRELIRGYKKGVSSASHCREVTLLQEVSDYLYSPDRPEITGGVESGFAAWKREADIVIQFLNREKFKSADEGFLTAIDLREVVVVGFLVWAKAINIDVRQKKSGKTALCGAAQDGNLQFVQYLADNGANPDLMDKKGRTALSYAAEFKHIKIVEYLLGDNKADIYIPDTQGKTAMDYTVNCGQAGQKIVDLLTREGANNNPCRSKVALQYSAEQGQLENVKYFANCGYFSDPKDRYGTNAQVALCRAAEKGHIEVVKLMLERGVPANSYDDAGDETPALCLAARNRHIDMVRLLIVDYKAKVNVDGHLCPNALCCAVFNNDLPMAKLLVGNSASLESKGVNHSYGAPLIRAVICQHIDMVRFLVEQGCDVNAIASPKYIDLCESDELIGSFLAVVGTMPSHFSVLCCAVMVGDSQIVNFLIQNGADVNAVPDDSDKYNIPLCCAAAQGSLPMVQLLLNAGAAIDLKDSEDKGAIEYARDHGHNLICAYFSGRNQQ